MNGVNAGITVKVALVEREEVGQPVDTHHGNEAGIVHLHAGYCVGNDQTPPLRENGRAVR